MSGILGFTRHVDTRHRDLPITFISNERTNPQSMVVLMPASLAATRPDRTRIHYHRWKWQGAWPTSLVLSMPDPALLQSTELNGAWFIHPEVDVIAAISEVVRDVAEGAGIPPERVVFYGSSLGGFGAIGCAAHLPGARAVAEVPQIDFEHWHPAAVKLVEKHAIGGPVSQLRAVAPEKLSLCSRIEFAGTIPPIHIVTNVSDTSLRDQEEFIAWCRSAEVPRVGGQFLELTDLAQGHKAIPQADATARVWP